MDRSRVATRAVYDEIAAHFDETRHHSWPEVSAFLEDVPAGGVGLDVGCGNGRHLAPMSERVEQAIGVDLSTELLGIARANLADREDGTLVDAAIDLVAGDAAALPIASDVVDVAVYVATLHHLPTREARIASLDELARVVAPGGRAQVSAWSTEHDRFDDSEGRGEPGEGFDTSLEWELPGGETRDRFYHIYDPAEFRADLAESELVVRRTQVSSGNCYARVAIQE